jgi:hypothetical protein
VTSATKPQLRTAVPPASPPGERSAPRWSLPALLAILALAAVLYSWNLAGSGLNSFYSAAVLSGTQSWKAWFFGSLDAGNFLTVDKPPLALMVMGLSCRVFGYGTWQMMAPMVVAALATIWVLHASVKRVFGHAAAAVAALVGGGCRRGGGGTGRVRLVGAVRLGRRLHGRYEPDGGAVDGQRLRRARGRWRPGLPRS